MNNPLVVGSERIYRGSKDIVEAICRDCFTPSEVSDGGWELWNRKDRLEKELNGVRDGIAVVGIRKYNSIKKLDPSISIVGGREKIEDLNIVRWLLFNRIDGFYAVERRSSGWRLYVLDTNNYEESGKILRKVGIRCRLTREGIIPIAELTPAETKEERTGWPFVVAKPLEDGKEYEVGVLEGNTIDGGTLYIFDPSDGYIYHYGQGKNGGYARWDSKRGVLVEVYKNTV